VDAVLSTQVLEHVADPLSVLAEFFRVLKPDGRLWLTAPFVWYLHEEPYDYYRFTSHGLRFLLERAGFIEIEVNH
jgi:ubiquinone/menaquinone biosynthesis C-methylase UbiE